MRKALLLIFCLFSTCLACELNESQCEIATKYGTATLSLTPRPIKPMVVSKLEIKGLKGVKAPKIHLFGLSMYLGHMREDLELGSGGELTAEIMIAPCTEEQMRFRLELLDDKEIIGFIDFTTFN